MYFTIITHPVITPPRPKQNTLAPHTLPITVLPPSQSHHTPLLPSTFPSYLLCSLFVNHSHPLPLRNKKNRTSTAGVDNSNFHACFILRCTFITLFSKEAVVQTTSQKPRTHFSHISSFLISSPPYPKNKPSVAILPF